MSRTSFRMNLHSIVCLNVKELLCQVESKWLKNSEVTANWSLSELKLQINFRYDMAPASNKEFLDIKANYRV